MAIYLDYNASTPCDPRVVEAMQPYLVDVFANPTSVHHRPGQEAHSALEQARHDIAGLLGAAAGTEIVFTGSATEANNLALVGAARALATRGRHLITQATEHASVLAPMRRLERDGWKVDVVGVDRAGQVSVADIERKVRPDTALISVMLANNETGTVQPVGQLARVAHEHGALLHCDAVQGIGKLPVNLAELQVDLLSVSAHKLYGPKGVGALAIRRQRPALRLDPIVLGGGQELGLRSGTVNLAAVVGLARALEIATGELESEAPRLRGLRDRLESALVRGAGGCQVNGNPEQRLVNTCNISFSGIDGTALLASLPDVAVSTGAACSAGQSTGSHVLLSMGVPRRLANSSLRLSVGRQTTESEIDAAAARIVEEVSRLRALRRA